MLQILFLIIKIIGIILAVLLGLALLILLLVLFVPVRYQAYGIRSSRECRAEGRVSWLLRLLCIPFSFQDGELEIKVKLLGFTILDPLKGEEEAFREPVQRKTEQSAGKKEGTAGADAEKEEETAEENAGEADASGSFEASQADETETSARPASEGAGEAAAESEDEASEGRFSRFLRELRRFLRAVIRFFMKIPRKLKNLKCTFQRFCDKIKRMVKRYREMKAFALDERTKAAVSLVWKQAGILLGQALPRKIRGRLHFGTEDPALTGQILGAIGIFYPLFMDNVKVEPDFEKPALEGELSLKGRLRIVTVLGIAWRLYRDKNVRYVYRRLNR